MRSTLRGCCRSRGLRDRTRAESVGPAVVAIAKSGELQYGTLLQGLFSVAGKSARDDVSLLAVQPFASYGLGDGWSVATSEVVFNYDFIAGRWASIPLGGRVEKLIHVGELPMRVFVDVEHNFADDAVGPKWVFRLAVVPLF